MNKVTESSSWLGLDIGGANIKVAFSATDVVSIPFPMWRQPERLVIQLRDILRAVPADKRLAVTMTGELADCFSNRQAGVEFIVDAVEVAAAGRPFYFYGIPSANDLANCWLTSTDAKKQWNRVAAANWHAIARFSGRALAGGDGFLIDIGSTTTDIIPIRAGVVVARGLTDFERLQCNELFYAGVARTPICSLCDSFLIQGQVVSAAREFFASIDDAFLLNGDAPEDSEHCSTADGRPFTAKFAAQRLAKMVCNDARQQTNHGIRDTETDWRLDEESIREIARQAIATLTSGIGESLKSVVVANSDLPTCFIISGQGDWFAKRIVEHEYGMHAETVLLADVVSQPVSRGAAAYAVAVLANEELSDTTQFVESVVAAEWKKTLSHSPKIRVIKLGGSLLKWDQWPAAVKRWLDIQPPTHNVWIVGGGKLVDVVREWDQQFPLSIPTSHWLCLDLMSVTKRLVASQFPDWSIFEQWPLPGNERLPENGLLDIASWLRGSETAKRRLPESWDITSDSCAAFFASEQQADELVLLKSCDGPERHDLQSLVDANVVDNAFAEFAKSIPSLRIVNLREQALA